MALTREHDIQTWYTRGMRKLAPLVLALILACSSGPSLQVSLAKAQIVLAQASRVSGLACSQARTPGQVQDCLVLTQALDALAGSTKAAQALAASPTPSQANLDQALQALRADQAALTAAMLAFEAD